MHTCSHSLQGRRWFVDVSLFFCVCYFSVLVFVLFCFVLLFFFCFTRILFRLGFNIYYIGLLVLLYHLSDIRLIFCYHKFCFWSKLLIATYCTLKMNSWSSWSPCTPLNGKCGPGTQYQTRSVATQPYCSAACPASRQTRSCKHSCCPVDCVVSTWTAWSACSTTCGTGRWHTFISPNLKHLKWNKRFDLRMK